MLFVADVGARIVASQVNTWSWSFVNLSRYLLLHVVDETSRQRIGQALTAFPKSFVSKFVRLLQRFLYSRKLIQVTTRGCERKTLRRKTCTVVCFELPHVWVLLLRLVRNSVFFQIFVCQ